MFQGLSTALTALYADRQALETTGNNIANVNTKGYSRERVDQSAINGAVNSFWATNSQVGQGTTVTGISRITDQFLQAQSLAAHGQQGQLSASNTALQSIQSAFNEPTDNGLQSQLSTFWKAWDAVGNDPGNGSTRTALVESSQSLVSNLQQISSSLDSQSTQSLSTVKGDVSQINVYAANIGQLNEAIQSQTNSGNTPNQLLDQRDALVSKLSDLVGITTSPTSANGISVNVGGIALVRDGQVSKINVDDSGSPAVLRWADPSQPNVKTAGDKVTLSSGGDVAGQLDIINSIVPKYKTMMDNVASALATTVNTQQAAGVDENGTAGVAFFTGTTAATIGVSTTIANDPTKIAAAQTGGGTLDGENARAMANLANSATGPDSVYQQTVNILGIDAQSATSKATIQQSITNNVDASVQSTSGVNLDEEMTNMVSYQRAYESAAKYLSVINSVMDSLMSIVQ